VEGDSASCAELFALLSSLSGLPLRQGIAVTGSVNQQGQVQPVGGVNEKIEGMFRVCQMRGLTGDQGVMIPKRNVRNLMLPGEVVAAIKSGAFHVWAIENVDEGIELLTGVPAGSRRKDGTWEPGTVNALVDARLAAMAKSLRPLAADDSFP
jgi:predicted ATP-dependent protease